MPRRRKAEPVQEVQNETAPTTEEVAASDSANSVLPNTDGTVQKEEKELDVLAVGRKVGPNFGIKYYDIGGDISFQLKDARTGRALVIEEVVTIKVVKEGGPYLRAEFFVPFGYNEIPYSSFDNKDLTIITGRTEDGRPKGRRLARLVCTGRGVDRLPGSPDIRMTKYVCRTDYETWVSLRPPTSLKGLGAPLKK